MPTEEPATADPPHDPQPGDRAERVIDAAKHKEKQKAFLALVVVTVGTLILGVLMILLVVLWGSRLRRGLRQSAGTKGRMVGGDFWFLNPKAVSNSDAASRRLPPGPEDTTPPQPPSPQEPS